MNASSVFGGSDAARLGVLGAGQLGRMLALAAHPLGIECIFLDPSESACAVDVGKRLRADFADAKVLQSLAAACPIVTLEFENVPAATLDTLSAHTTVWPPQEALAVAQDRLREKQLFQRLGIPVGPFAAIDGPEDFAAAIEAIGLPAILKARRMGYDGKGQAMVDSAEDLPSAWQAIGEAPAILEGRIPLQREISIIAVRAFGGEMRFYDASENLHRNGMLVRAQPRPDEPLAAAARTHTAALMDALSYVGVMAFEFFVGPEECLLANEIAPRVHNSGHWTIEGAHCSQFENHIRAVTGLPLGDTRTRGPCVMINLIGSLPDRAQVLGVEGAHLHHYGKAPRPGRKVGHITLTAADTATLKESESQLLALLRGSTGKQQP
ncbi:5-(carboxyamino)imidazole ribonucleotide synthase [Algiphilus sp.]|uniref:5-(carboxyamino)imidazole ribonucleotide synthase n=1 Tax=Algiphilus sp. TaxID=1872431 RepID=UPI003BA9DCB2